VTDTAGFATERQGTRAGVRVLTSTREEQQVKSRFAASAVAIALLPLCGCHLGDTGNPDAVLEGTWEMTGEALGNNVTDFLITFDDNGDITEVQYMVGAVQVEFTDIDSTTTVDGSSVSINASWGGPSQFIFDGTLNDSQDVIDGDVSYSLTTDGVNINAPVGPATLTKQ
jgi:hypothetical protein